LHNGEGGRRSQTQQPLRQRQAEIPVCRTPAQNGDSHDAWQSNDSECGKHGRNSAVKEIAKAKGQDGTDSEKSAYANPDPELGEGAERREWHVIPVQEMLA
jgi:hypothetical protein